MEPGTNEKANTGEWEIHLTIGGSFNSDAPCSWDALSAWADAQEWKCVHIVLSRGRTASQPMLTRCVKGTQAHAVKVARDARDALSSAGFSVSRVKMEIPPWSDGFPQTVRDAQNLPMERYFEHHVKLLMPADVDTTPLAQMAEKHGANLSRNARRTRPDHQTERFVTQRCFGVGRDGAHARLDALLRALTPLGFPVLEVEEEFVVYDSNLDLDAGWINEKE